MAHHSVNGHRVLLEQAESTNLLSSFLSMLFRRLELLLSLKINYDLGMGDWRLGYFSVKQSLLVL